MDDGILDEVDGNLARAEPTWRSANPNHLKTERLVSKLRLCGECWQINWNFSLIEMMKVPSLSLQSMPVQKFSDPGSKKRHGKPSVQTCSSWKRTSVCSHCTWSVCSWYSWYIATGYLSNQHGQCVMAAPSPHRLPAATFFFAMQKCAKMWLQMNWRSQNTVWLHVQKWTTKSRREEICTLYCVCVVKPSTTPMTTWAPRPRTPSARRTWTLTRECAVLLFVSQVLVVMIHMLHRMAQGCCACHLIHAGSVRFSCDFQSSIPLNFSHVPSFILNFVQSLLNFSHHFEGPRTQPKRVWTLLTTPTSSQVRSPRPQGDLRLVLQSSWPPTVLQARVSSRMWITMTPTRRDAS